MKNINEFETLADLNSYVAKLSPGTSKFTNSYLAGRKITVLNGSEDGNGRVSEEVTLSLNEVIAKMKELSAGSMANLSCSRSQKRNIREVKGWIIGHVKNLTNEAIDKEATKKKESTSCPKCLIKLAIRIRLFFINLFPSSAGADSKQKIKSSNLAETAIRMPPPEIFSLKKLVKKHDANQKRYKDILEFVKDKNDRATQGFAKIRNDPLEVAQTNTQVGQEIKKAYVKKSRRPLIKKEINTFIKSKESIEAEKNKKIETREKSSRKDLAIVFKLKDSSIEIKTLVGLCKLLGDESQKGDIFTSKASIANRFGSVDAALINIISRSVSADNMLSNIKDWLEGKDLK